MKRLSIYSLLVVLFITQLACNLLRALPVAPAQTSLADTPFPVITTGPTETPLTPETPSSSHWSLDLLKNYTYFLEDFQIQATFKDGVYQDDQIYARLIEPAAFGDLNGDGLEDAAVTLAINSGGSGTFFNLIALLGQEDTLVQAGSSYIGDRQVINDLKIGQGRLILDYLTQGLNDALCCPSERRLRSYILENGALHLASEQVLDNPAAPATPLPNAILIDHPKMVDRLTTPQQVRGRVSQVPPEKKLAYYVTDLNATLLTQGEVLLEGEPGLPASFSFEFTLEMSSPGLVFVEVVDSANGILRGRSVVELVVQ